VTAFNNSQSLIAKKGPKIRKLSTLLKYACFVGIVFFLLFNAIYWFIEGFQSLRIIGTQWSIQFSDMPLVGCERLSPLMKFLGFAIDLIPGVFVIAMLWVLAKLFEQFEQLFFFSRKNISYMRWVGLLFICKQLVYPFYIALRTSIFTPSSQDLILYLSGPNSLRSVFIIIAIFFASYIMEVGLFLEEEFIATI
jgi:hypothetical protein